MSDPPTVGSGDNLPAAPPSVFNITDHLDAQQIADVDNTLKGILVYEAHGKKHLTAAGVREVAYDMSLEGHALEEIGDPVIELFKPDVDDTKTWIYKCHVKMRNVKTGMVRTGIAENPHNEERKQKGKLIVTDVRDPLGERKAHGKAERNAIRKQIPEARLQAFAQTVESGRILKVDEQPATEVVHGEKQAPPPAAPEPKPPATPDPAMSPAAARKAAEDTGKEYMMCACKEPEPGQMLITSGPYQGYVTCYKCKSICVEASTADWEEGSK